MIRSIFVFTALLIFTGCASNPEKSASAAKKKQEVSKTVAEPTPKSSVSPRATPVKQASIKPPLVVKQAPPPPKVDDLWAQLRDGFDLPELDNDRVAYYEKRFTR